MLLGEFIDGDGFRLTRPPVYKLNKHTSHEPPVMSRISHDTGVSVSQGYVNYGHIHQLNPCPWLGTLECRLLHDMHT